MSAIAKIYFRNFDGLRFFAALAVICAHYAIVFGDHPDMGKWTWIIFTLDNSGAEAGVNFFFVLSGVLITYLILADSGSKTVAFIPKFYLRRVLRIWPLYYLTVAIGFWIYPLITDVPNYVEVASGLMYGLFLANLDQICCWHATPHPNLLLGVHWSVAVEEQFYLVWPWIILLARRRFVALGLVLVVGAWLFQNATKLPTHTISCFHDLTIGGLTAYFCFHYPATLQRFFSRWSSRSLWLVAYSAGLLFIVARYQLTMHFPFYALFYRTAHALIFAAIIIDQGFNNHSPLQMSRIPLISYFGKISYGLYLLHPIALLLVGLASPSGMPPYLGLLVVIIVTILISMASYHFFESFFLKLKAKYGATRKTITVDLEHTAQHRGERLETDR